MRFRALIPVAWALSHLPPVLAQVATDGSLGPTHSFQGTTMDITADFGKISGGNLFHSFQSFSIPAGAVATFSGPADVANILARVTGTELSRIDGKLASSILGANLFLMNPNGVLFGAGATLDVSGSFAATTAHQIGFASGPAFTAKLSPDVQLSAAPPAAFGFLGPSGTITLSGSKNISVGAGHSLQLVGGDITLDNEASVLFPGANALIAAQNSAGTVPIATRDPAPPSGTGQVLLTGGSLLGTAPKESPGTGQSGTLVIRAGRLRVESQSLLQNDTSTSGNTPSTDIQVAGDIAVSNGASIQSKANRESAKGGQLALSAQSIHLTDGGKITADGSLFVRAESLRVENLSTLQNDTTTSGNPASTDIQISGDIIVSGGSQIQSKSSQETDKAGQISLRAQSIRLDDRGKIFADGSLVVRAESLRVENRSTLQNDTTTSGNPASTDIQISGDIVVAVSALIQSKALHEAGTGGRLNLKARSIQLDSGGSINVDSGTGNPFGEPTKGDGTHLTLTANRLELSDSSITAKTLPDAAGTAPTVEISAKDSVTLKGSARFSMDSSGLSESQATLDVTTREFNLVGSTVGLSPTILAGTFGAASGAIVTITADTFTLSGGSAIKLDTTTDAAGNAGNLFIDARTVTLTDSARISASTYGAGGGGKLSIHSDSVALIPGANSGNSPVISAEALSGGSHPGGNKAGSISIDADRIVIASGGLDTSTSGTTDAGDILLVSKGDLELSGNGYVASRTEGTGLGGTIELNAGKTLSINGAAAVETSASGEGDAGVVNMTSGTLIIAQNGAITASTRGERGGSGGTITLQTRTLTLDGGRISSTSSGPGKAGSVTVNAADQFHLKGGGRIDVASLNSEAGDITIKSGGDLRIDGPGPVLDGGSSRPDSLSSSGKSGGRISLNALGDVLLRDCTLTARADGPVATDSGGMIEIPFKGSLNDRLPRMVLLDGVILNASANGGPGGTILIATPAYVKSADTQFLFSNSNNEPGTESTPSFQFQTPIEPPKFALNYRDGIEWQEPSGWATRDREDYTRVGDLGSDAEAGNTRRRIRLDR